MSIAKDGIVFCEFNRGAGAEVYRIASVSKVITALAVITFVNQAGLSLDQEILPDGTTLKHLLSHTSGWDSVISKKSLHSLNKLIPAKGRDSKAIANYIRGLPKETLPGAAYAYSNLGYIFLGDWLEGQFGKAFELIVDELVVRGRVKLYVGEYGENANYYWPLVSGRHASLMDKNYWNNNYLSLQEILPAGGWAASALDVSKLFSYFDLSILAPKFESSSSESYYALGVRVWNVEGRFFFSHYGFMDGVFCLLIQSADSGNTFFLQGNSSVLNPSYFSREVLRTVIRYL